MAKKLDIIAEIEESLRVVKRPPGAVTVMEMVRRTKASPNGVYKRLEDAVRAGRLRKVSGVEAGKRKAFYVPV